jgi:uncharacterized protein
MVNVATAFTPIASLAGGALIGVAAVMLMGLTGRIAGVSGIAARLLPPYTDGELGGRLAFVAGLIAAPLVFLVVSGKLPPQTIQADGSIASLRPWTGLMAEVSHNSGMIPVRMTERGRP